MQHKSNTSASSHEKIIKNLNLGNSRDNWTTLLNEITNLEYSIIQAKSLKIKIAPDSERLERQEVFFIFFPSFKFAKFFSFPFFLILFLPLFFLCA